MQLDTNSSKVKLIEPWKISVDFDVSIKFWVLFAAQS